MPQLPRVCHVQCAACGVGTVQTAGWAAGGLQVGCRWAAGLGRTHVAAHEVGTEIADGGVVDRYRERLLVSEPFPHLQRRELGAWLHSDQRPVGHSAGV